MAEILQTAFSKNTILCLGRIILSASTVNPWEWPRWHPSVGTAIIRLGPVLTCHSYTAQSNAIGTCAPFTRYVKLRCACNGNVVTYPRHRLQRKPLVSDTSMHHGTCVTCHDACQDRYPAMVGKKLPAHAQPAILRIWQEAHGRDSRGTPVRIRMYGLLYLRRVEYGNFLIKFHWSLFSLVKLTRNYFNSNNALAPNMRQAMCTNDDTVY